MPPNVQFDYDAIDKFADQVGTKGLQAVGLLIVGSIKGKISQEGTGLLYGSHRASAPGQPPASDTGTLLRSIDITRVNKTPIGLSIRVVANTEYAAGLELGTEKMAERPYMATTLYENLDASATVFRANT